MKDSLLAVFVKFLWTWLADRTLQVRIGQTLRKPINLGSVVPQGSVFAPTIWNYYTGDIPPSASTHSDTAVYADDSALAVTHPKRDTLQKLTQTEISQLENWAICKRIKFEQKQRLAIHRNPVFRRIVKDLPLFLGGNNSHTPLFNIKPWHSQGRTFVPSESVAKATIARRQPYSTRITTHQQWTLNTTPNWSNS